MDQLKAEDSQAVKSNNVFIEVVVQVDGNDASALLKLIKSIAMAKAQIIKVTRADYTFYGF
jgi:hypothetical protein